MRIRPLHHLIALVTEAEDRDWYSTHPTTLQRAQDRLWDILWNTDRELATLVYGEAA